MKKTFLFLGTILFLLGCDQKPKMESDTTNNASTSETQANLEASKYTIEKNNELKSYLDFTDKTDYENATKGFIATIPSGIINQGNGELAYSMKAFDFLKGDAPDTANPSLWRQSELNAINGLFKVVDGIYQIRGFDLANMTLVEGKTGWIIIDPLTGKETAAAAMKLVDEQLGKKPVKAIIFTHSHIDHFGGAKGIATQEEINSGKVRVYAPEGFYEHSISENIMAGNTMTRRAMYMYGNLLPKNETGSFGSGLGTENSQGTATIFEPTDIISSEDAKTLKVDGIDVDFIYTPASEAPAEMMFYFPKYKAFCQSENVSHTLHNLYTLRGAQVRNGQKWSNYIDRSIVHWGKEMEVSFGSHHWPTWGNDNIVPYLEKQRDTYRFIHDQTLRLANEGYTPIELAEMIKLPDALGKEFYNRGYYGSVSHDVKAQYQLYYGWFDGNPANLNPHTPEESGKRFVEMMGGASNVIEKAKKYYDEGDYRWVAQVLNNVVFAEPTNQKARDLLADAYTQLGYQAESGPWRNFYLTGAKELREGMKKVPMSSAASADIISGMDTQLFFEFLGMTFKGTENSDIKANFNIIMPDVNEKLTLVVSNGMVMPRMNILSDNPTTTITMDREDLNKFSLGEVTAEDLLKSGKVKIEGDGEAYKNFLSKLDAFDLWFNIIEP